ncbi:hypothetical protein B0I35DRAFT_409880 [Stachybotrys elegans]|uniref:MFS maltose permease n=1 Tax=Stachybotrys elegans TaxID=80388 RepID=A0A8K0WPQ5_9HYPO|nr:hypothetical protein B0I35DRAFT_409880 [Stachybotrys elegans]
MSSRLLVSRLSLGPSQIVRGRQRLQYVTLRARLSTRSTRPNIPFLSPPSSQQTLARRYASTRGQWMKHEAKLVVRYMGIFWGIFGCLAVIGFFVNEEVVERVYPTPHEWSFLTRKMLRDSHMWIDPTDGLISWGDAYRRARITVFRLEDPNIDGADTVRSEITMNVPQQDSPLEFAPLDVSAKSEEWRRGYFEALTLATKTAEQVEGWLIDKHRKLVSPPEYVIGPSNPHPKPVPAGVAAALREEDCELAYPEPHHYYVKLMATKGFTPRQYMEIMLSWASYAEYKKDPETAREFHRIALNWATNGQPDSVPNPSRLPYDSNFVLSDKGSPPSFNVLTALTSLATFTARQGDVAAALPMFISILKARRSLSNEAPPAPRVRRKQYSLFEQVTNIIAPPDYPAPPPDGTQPPWRDPEERCQEAALALHIGEILFSTSSREEGLAWTREGVDEAEEQLRKLSPENADTKVTTSCRDCLGMGMENWAIMAARLAKEEAAQKAKGPQSSVFGFWSTSQDAPDRWAAEELVVKERARRTKELLENVRQPQKGFLQWFQA